MNCWNRVVQTIATSGKPVLYADFQYGGSGGFLVYTAGFLRSKAPNVGFVASSRIEDLVEAVKCFELVEEGRLGGGLRRGHREGASRRARPRPGDLACKPDPVKTLSPQECLGRMKESKILAVRDQNAGPGEHDHGHPGRARAVRRTQRGLEGGGQGRVPRGGRPLAQERRGGDRGVSRETLETSAAMYLGKKAVLKKHGANAITINCLGGFYGGHIHAYPCLGFHELNNEGLVGACECDVRSAATMVTVTALTQGRPGYISDPVIDTAKRQIIYAHCVASNKVFGPQGETNPFADPHPLRGPPGRLGPLAPAAGLHDHHARVRARAARRSSSTGQGRGQRPGRPGLPHQAGAEPVGDIEKLFTMWDQWGWHRVTFYGDLKEPVFALADALGWKVVEEA